MSRHNKTCRVCKIRDSNSYCSITKQTVKRTGTKCKYFIERNPPVYETRRTL